MATYVSDWSQEVYGDLRATRFPVRIAQYAASTSTTISSISSSSRGPGLGRSSRHATFLRAAYSPRRTGLGRARPPGAGRWCPSSRWPRTSPPRSTRCAPSSPRPGKHATTGGSAWPREIRPTFRLPTSRADRPDPRPDGGRDPRLGRRGPGKARTERPARQETFCLVDLPGAAHNGAWRSFRAWTQPTSRPLAPQACRRARRPFPRAVRAASAVRRAGSP